jgi:hypothetical protein
MKRTFYISACSVLLILVQNELAGMTKSGTTVAQFLKVQVGGRAVSLGGAYVAAASDASAIYWNPAGLVRIPGRGTACFGHTPWLADTKHNFAAAAFRIGSGNVMGLSFTSLTMPDMEVRTEFQPEGTGEFFSAIDLSMGVTFARAVTDRFSIGATMKYVRQQIWHMSASAVVFDLGLLFQTDFDWLTLGISVSNFGPKMQYEGKDTFINYDFDPDRWGDNDNIYAHFQTDRWDLPLIFRFGLAAEIISSDMNQLACMVEARHPNDQEESVSMGLEYGFKRRFFARTGYQSLFESDSEKGLTFGIGLVYYLGPTSPMMLDYAYADWGRLTQVHRFSIEFNF